jgi:hypothetical protein
LLGDAGVGIAGELEIDEGAVLFRLAFDSMSVVSDLVSVCEMEGGKSAFTSALELEVLVP